MATKFQLFTPSIDSFVLITGGVNQSMVVYHGSLHLWAQIML